MEGFSHFLTLNYGTEAPTDDKVVKRHLDRIKTFLRRKNIKLLWKQEFCKSGRPHFHLLLDNVVDRDELRQRWAKYIDAPETPHLIHVSPILDYEKALSYMVKNPSHYANRVPEHYANMGRFHGSSGLQVEPELIIEATEEELAPIIRLLKKMKRAAGIPNRRRDNGLTSMTVWAVGGDSVSKALGRYWIALQGTEVGNA